MIKILIVEDNEFDREKIIRSLSSSPLKYEFKILESAHKFEKVAIEWKPDLVIMDLFLPEFNGIEILRDLNVRWGRIPYPIVIASGTGNESLAVESMKLGALDYVVKEKLTAFRLEEVVNRAIEKSHLQQKIQEQNEMLEISQKRFRLAMESANMGAWEWDLKTNLIYWDAQAARIMGIEETKEPRSMVEFLANVQEGYKQELFNPANSTETYQEYQYVFPVVLRDQTIRWVKSYGKTDASNLENGKAVRFHGTCLDVTEQHLYKELQASYLLSSRSDILGLHVERDLREQFVSTLSHDLRNPLAAAKMGTQLILRSPHGKPIEPALQRIVVSLNRVDNMIQDLLDANRIGAGQKVPLNIIESDLTEIINESLFGLRLDHSERFVFDQKASVIGFWDKFGIQRVIENLLSNAIKYGIPDTKVAIVLTESPTSVTFTICNLSQGLSKTDQENIFKPFHRTSSADNSNVRGWGLGLTIVKGITETHGGHVSVLSVANESVTFTVELPKDCRN